MALIEPVRPGPKPPPPPPLVIPQKVIEFINEQIRLAQISNRRVEIMDNEIYDLFKEYFENDFRIWESYRRRIQELYGSYGWNVEYRGMDISQPALLIFLPLDW